MEDWVEKVEEVEVGEETYHSVKWKLDVLRTLSDALFEPSCLVRAPGGHFSLHKIVQLEMSHCLQLGPH